MAQTREKHLVRGMIAGAGAGCAAAWLMNQFMSGPGEKLHHAVESDEQRQAKEQQRKQGQNNVEQDATMKASDVIVSTITGGRHLSIEEQRKGAPLVRYGLGTFAGAIYGGLAEYSPAARTGFGAGFGAALFASGDLVAVPALHLAPPISQFPPSSFVNPFAAHLVYGTATELLRRVIRLIL